MAVVLVVFVLTYPIEAAGATHTVVGWLEEGAMGIVTFVKALFA